MRNACKRKTSFYALVIIVFIALLHFDFGPHQSFNVLKKDVIVQYLYEEVGKNLSVDLYAKCRYHDILFDKTVLPLSLADGDLKTGHRIREGGEFVPSECKPKFSVAIIVPYKDKAEQLRSFLIYMHTFLRHQRLHYRIYVVEQVDNQAFNPSKLKNIGAYAAIKAGFPCIILHSMNLLPLNLNNLYACTQNPRLMSSSIKKYRFLPSVNIVSGVFSITAKQFTLINGMSNEYFGWEGEDNLFFRLNSHKLTMCQYNNDMSQYYLLGEDEFIGVKKKPEYFTKEIIAADGLNSLHYKEVAMTLHPLFTHIVTDLEN